jgi:K+ transporter
LRLSAGRTTTQFAIWAKYGNEWRFITAPSSLTEVTLADDGALQPAIAVVSAVDRLGNESERVTAQL